MASAASKSWSARAFATSARPSEQMAVAATLATEMALPQGTLSGERQHSRQQESCCQRRTEHPASFQGVSACVTQDKKLCVLALFFLSQRRCRHLAAACFSLQTGWL